ncbi:hypothetical protein [Paenibacillus graminis]|uniref:Uncharacterized protein n=1 Tax=Paenibacillus graminis TaxID=189425 RepID=A0A089M9E0_9BACL|nr:hypothetical protein [Paenibacillus graminis]AIQ70391.1 hypothetical protein PGRAT_24230 [Paenibacillus graminis]
MKEGEEEIISGPSGTYTRYYLSNEELQKYRDMPQDTFWDHNAKPNTPPKKITKKSKHNKEGA